MATADGRYVLSYNGEVYNFRELRAELEALGVASTPTAIPRSSCTRSPTGGATALSRFNGMFALALWDRDERTAAARARPLRDQADVLPRARATRSCSPPRSRRCLRTRAIASRSIARRCVEYFTFQNFFTSRTLFRGVSLLPAGDGDGDRRARRRASSATGTSASASPRMPSSEQEYLEELDRLFRQAVNRQLVSRRASRLLLQRRNGLGLDRRARGVRDRVVAHVHRRLRPALGLRPRARVRRAGTGRAPVVPAQDRALRDGAQVGRHGARHGGRSSGTSRSRASARAIRTSTPPSWRRSSSRWCSREPAATSCSAAIRGAITGRWSTTISTTTSTSTTASGSGSSPNDDRARVRPDQRRRGRRVDA